jgi:hypothetical protein
MTTKIINLHSPQVHQFLCTGHLNHNGVARQLRHDASTAQSLDELITRSSCKNMMGAKVLVYWNSTTDFMVSFPM